MVAGVMAFWSLRRWTNTLREGEVAVSGIMLLKVSIGSRL